MTSPHEEHWLAKDGDVVRFRDGARIVRVFTTDPNTKAGQLVARDDACARLIAQAPAMARLLLDLFSDPHTYVEDRERIEPLLRSAGVLP